MGSRLDGERIESKTRLIGGNKIEEHTVRSFHAVKEESVMGKKREQAER